MVFISERIINISELEALLSGARLCFELLVAELQEETPQTEKVQNLTCSVKNKLAEAENFEFCIEKRRCFLKDDSENPKSVENPTGEGSPV